MNVHLRKKLNKAQRLKNIVYNLKNRKTDDYLKEIAQHFQLQNFTIIQLCSYCKSV